MEATEIINLLSGNGVAIAMCGLLFWYMIKQQENHKTEIDSLRESQQKQTEELTKSVNALEIAIVKLTDKIDGGTK